MGGSATYTQGSANQKLWLAVIETAVAEWVRGPIRHRRKAEYFLFQDNNDFPFICHFAGLDPESVREALRRIRNENRTNRTRMQHSHASSTSSRYQAAFQAR